MRESTACTINTWKRDGPHFGKSNFFPFRSPISPSGVRTYRHEERNASFRGRNRIPFTERHESFPGTIPFETFGISISKKCKKKFAQIHVIEIQNSSIGTGPSRRVASRMRFVERQGKFLENSSDNRRTLTDNHPFRFTEYKLLRHNAVPCIRARAKSCRRTAGHSPESSAEEIPLLNPAGQSRNRKVYCGPNYYVKRDKVESHERIENQNRRNRTDTCP